MTDVQAMADAIIRLIDAEPGVKEFKRTIQHDDGSSETYRVDITEIGPTRFVASSVRQVGGGARRETGPKQFTRSDRQGLATWLSSSTEK